MPKKPNSPIYRAGVGAPELSGLHGHQTTIPTDGEKQLEFFERRGDESRAAGYTVSLFILKARLACYYELR